MGNSHEITKRWRGAGEVVLWVICYFWAVWVLNALLPAKPAQTPVEAYLGGQLEERLSGRSSPQASPAEARDPSEQIAAGAAPPAMPNRQEFPVPFGP